MIHPRFRNVVIFGSSRGIGRALAIEYSSLKSNLILFSRNDQDIKSLSEDITNLGATAFFRKCDVSLKDNVKDAVDFAIEKLETIDLAVLNAGIGKPVWMTSFNSNDFKEVMETNTFGIAHALEYLIPVMLKQGYGTIAGVTSLSDVRGYPGSSSYCASKAAASILLESARVELKKSNIDVITVKPGFVKTAMTDKNEFYMPLIMSPEKAARIIRKGIEKKKSIVQFPFAIVNLTRLAKYAPNFLFDNSIITLRHKLKN